MNFKPEFIIEKYSILIETESIYDGVRETIETNNIDFKELLSDMEYLLSQSSSFKILSPLILRNTDSRMFAIGAKFYPKFYKSALSLPKETIVLLEDTLKNLFSIYDVEDISSLVKIDSLRTSCAFDIRYYSPYNKQLNLMLALNYFDNELYCKIISTAKDYYTCYCIDTLKLQNINFSNTINIFNSLLTTSGKLDFIKLLYNTYVESDAINRTIIKDSIFKLSEYIVDNNRLKEELDNIIASIKYLKSES